MVISRDRDSFFADISIFRQASILTWVSVQNTSIQVGFNSRGDGGGGGGGGGGPFRKISRFDIECRGI